MTSTRRPTLPRPAGLRARRRCPRPGPPRPQAAAGDLPSGRRIVDHRVRPGETATGLAVRFHAWTAELIARNHLGADGHIRVGQRIEIPVVVAALPRTVPAPARPTGPTPRPTSGTITRRRSAPARPGPAHRAPGRGRARPPATASTRSWRSRCPGRSPAGRWTGARRGGDRRDAGAAEHRRLDVDVRRAAGCTRAGSPTTPPPAYGCCACCAPRPRPGGAPWRRTTRAWARSAPHGLYGETHAYVANVLAHEAAARGGPPARLTGQPGTRRPRHAGDASARPQPRRRPYDWGPGSFPIRPQEGRCAATAVRSARPHGHRRGHRRPHDRAAARRPLPRSARGSPAAAWPASTRPPTSASTARSRSRSCTPGWATTRSSRPGSCARPAPPPGSPTPTWWRSTTRARRTAPSSSRWSWSPGHTLRDVIRKESPMPPARALALLEPVLSALAAAHRAGLDPPRRQARERADRRRPARRSRSPTSAWPRRSAPTPSTPRPAAS